MRHLDGVPLETPIRDIVHHCRVWQSHADTGTRRILKPGLEMALPVYTVDEPGCVLADQMVAAVTAPPARTHNLEALLLRLLPTTPVPTPPSKPIPTELESLLQRLLSGALAPAPAPPPKTGITDMETLLQHLFPGTPAPASRTRPGCIRRDWAMIVCLSCGKSVHGVGRCPKLNETFPYMLPGWSAEMV